MIARTHRNYLIKHRMGRFDVYPPHSDVIAEMAGLPSEAIAEAYIDQRIQVIAAQNEREADGDGYTD